ncbi:hypothetical protein DY251_20455 [Mesorhizobium denitrificans]|uniref:Uncharacterized protein n=1 Tax=Mesorhizobium denitrificans TaxID=2294114 RepID=A0A371X3Q0_9HYPH|nr:hypothetical protein DY251_20455 [Mesorhizobium denitrificans]
MKPLALNVHTSFQNRDGEPLDIYELSSLDEKRNQIHMRFSRINEPLSFKADVTISLLRTLAIKVTDFKAAPSFVVRTYVDHRILEFISVRKKAIDRLRVPRSKPTT